MLDLQHLKESREKVKELGAWFPDPVQYLLDNFDAIVREIEAGRELAEGLDNLYSDNWDDMPDYTHVLLERYRKRHEWHSSLLEMARNIARQAIALRGVEVEEIRMSGDTLLDFSSELHTPEDGLQILAGSFMGARLTVDNKLKYGTVVAQLRN